MSPILLDAYFEIRPLLPQRFRLAARRFLLNRSKRKAFQSWPIHEQAGLKPENWMGWPCGKKFAFVLTHDVESKKGLNRCLRLAETEMRLGYRSCFNFVPEGGYETPPSLRHSLTENGFEVGVHDLVHDGKLYRSRRSFKEYAQRINCYLQDWGAVGFRSGFMLHRLDWIGDLNVAYDGSSFDTDPFEPQSDGMNTIFPFWVSRSDGSGFVEMPYTLPQDSTLFLLLRESGIDIWQRKLDWIAQRGGLALLCVHPDYINFNGTKNSLEYGVHLYEEFLNTVATRYRNEAWFALPQDVAAHVRRSRFGHAEQESSASRQDIDYPADERYRRESAALCPVQVRNKQPNAVRGFQTSCGAPKCARRTPV